jgi:hypothetical protein
MPEHIAGNMWRLLKDESIATVDGARNPAPVNGPCTIRIQYFEGGAVIIQGPGGNVYATEDQLYKEMRRIKQ